MKNIWQGTITLVAFLILCSFMSCSKVNGSFKSLWQDKDSLYLIKLSHYSKVDSTLPGNGIGYMYLKLLHTFDSAGKSKTDTVHEVYRIKNRDISPPLDRHTVRHYMYPGSACEDPEYIMSTIYLRPDKVTLDADGKIDESKICYARKINAGLYTLCQGKRTDREKEMLGTVYGWADFYVVLGDEHELKLLKNYPKLYNALQNEMGPGHKIFEQ